MRQPVPWSLVPRELAALEQWVVWRLKRRASDPKPAKIPYTRTGDLASSTDASTWSSFPVVVKAAARFNGIGIALIKANGLIGGDLDESRDRRGRGLGYGHREDGPPGPTNPSAPVQ
jgi:primase-polymerase (primpol)-like protein